MPSAWKICSGAELQNQQDPAHVLSPDASARIDSLCGNLSHSKANAQIEVVTIKSLDGDDAADFANRLEERWKIGKKGADRGILMLFAIQDHKRWNRRAIRN